MEQGPRRAIRQTTMAVVVMSVWSATVLAVDSGKALTQLVLDSWQTEEGLPQSAVHAVLETPDGFLWVGTEEGLVRFDGAGFRVYDTSNTPALRNDHIWALAEDRGGTLWIGTYGGGLTRLRDGIFSALTTKEGLPSDIVRTLHADRAGALWVGTDGGGLARIERDMVTTFTTREGLPHDRVNAVAEDGNGTIWVGTDDGGLARLQAGRFQDGGARDLLHEEDVNALDVDRTGALWVGTDGGLVRIAAGGSRRFTRRDGLPHDWVNTLGEDRDGALWVATSGGLVRLRDGRFEALTAKEGLPNATVLTVYEDRAGRIWFGSAGGGLARLKDGVAATFGPREGLSYDIASTILEDRHGTLWVGTYGGGLNRRRDDGRWDLLTTRDGLPDDAITSLFEDRAGALWVGTRRGLCRLAGGRFVAVGAGDATARTAVRALAEGRDGSLWIGTYGAGVLRLHGESWTHYGREHGLTHEHVQAVHMDAHGRLWVGTDGGGLNRFDGERFAPVPGLASDVIDSFHEDSGGALWVGTGAGPCRLENDRVRCLGTREGLFDDYAYRILDDGLGSLWFSGNKGVYRVAKQDLDDLAAGRRATVTPIVYGRADGMRGVECNGGVQPAGWRARDGGVWFPTVEGAVRFDPHRAVTTLGTPPLVIERALVDHREVDPARMPELPPGRGDLEIHYAALDLGDPQRVAYRYQLEGFDDDWVDAGGRRIAYYTNVPPGRYRFRVAAARSDGAWRGAEGAIGFALEPRFHQTPVFFALAAAGVMLATWGMHRLRVRRLRTRQAELELLVQERTRSLVEATRRLEEAQQRQADFVSGVSHALKTPLTLIRLYGETLHQGEGFSDDDRRSYSEIITRESERLTRLIERVLDFSRVDRGDKRYQIGPGDLATVVRQALDIAARHLQREGFEVEVRIDPALPPARFDPDAVVDAVLNLVDNAAKYSGDARYVGIRLRAEGNRIICEIEDRGLGIPAAEREDLFRKFHRGRDATGKGGYGLGLFLVKHIMDAHGGAIEVESEVGRGSRFRLIFPADGEAPPPPAAGATPSPSAIV
ncbi:MAG TPA: two-component regulator propeller domain-containing protein [Candidatus Polarisedimenticolia bacterium]|nr:two-component regulator propeller domain-containing protein [Candidatus Polarisedimenticolia bacterium]